MMTNPATGTKQIELALWQLQPVGTAIVGITKITKLQNCKNYNMLNVIDIIAIDYI